MIQLRNKEDCCGCSACKLSCPKKCIELQADKEGFLYPLIDESKCVHCNICNRVCPIENQEYGTIDKKCIPYVAYAKDNGIRKVSSSGGIFSILAKEVLKDKGIICGATFDSDFKKVYHCCIERIEELPKLQGSKYIQSELLDCYQEIERNLKDDRKVLFTGTACQVAGVKRYLKKDYNNLITVDVLCHGVPSQKVWEKYLTSLETKKKALTEKVSLRNKNKGWKNYSVSILFKNGNKYQALHQEDSFMRLFLADICLRPSCYACKFKDIDRMSDLTIGDCWGVEKHSPEMDDDQGTSVILVHTNKGKMILEKVGDDLCIKPSEIDVVLPLYSDSRRSVKMHMNRNKLFKKLNSGANIEQLEKLIEPSYIERAENKLRRILTKN